MLGVAGWLKARVRLRMNVAGVAMIAVAVSLSLLVPLGSAAPGGPGPRHA